MFVGPRPVACLPAEPQPPLTTEGALRLKRQLIGHVLAATTKSSSGFAGDGIQQRRKRAAVVDRVLTVPPVAGRGLVRTFGVRRDVPNALTAGVTAASFTLKVIPKALSSFANPPFLLAASVDRLCCPIPPPLVPSGVSSFAVLLAVCPHAWLSCPVTAGSCPTRSVGAACADAPIASDRPAASMERVIVRLMMHFRRGTRVRFDAAAA